MSLHRDRDRGVPTEKCCKARFCSLLQSSSEPVNSGSPRGSFRTRKWGLRSLGRIWVQGLRLQNLSYTAKENDRGTELCPAPLLLRHHKQCHVIAVVGRAY